MTRDFPAARADDGDRTEDLGNPPGPTAGSAGPAAAGPAAAMAGGPAVPAAPAGVPSADGGADPTLRSVPRLPTAAWSASASAVPWPPPPAAAPPAAPRFASIPPPPPGVLPGVAAPVPPAPQVGSAGPVQPATAARSGPTRAGVAPVPAGAGATVPPASPTAPPAGSVTSPETHSATSSATPPATAPRGTAPPGTAPPGITPAGSGPAGGDPAGSGPGAGGPVGIAPPGPTVPGNAPPGAHAAPPAAPPLAPQGTAVRPRRRSRRLLVGLAAGLVLALLGGAGVVAQRAGALDRLLGDRRAAPAAGPALVPAAPPVLTAADGTAATAAGVRTALDAVLGGAGIGGAVGVSVVDLDGGAVLYDRRAAAPLIPASTMKLVTALAVLSARGPAYRIATRAVAGERPGDVVLVGGGDPTLSADGAGTYPFAARLDRLAARVRAALGGRRPSRVLVDTSLFTGPVFGTGWDSDIPTGGSGGAVTALMINAGRAHPGDEAPTPRHPTPDLAAGRAFAALLGAGTVARGTAPAPPPAGAAARRAAADPTAADPAGPDPADPTAAEPPATGGVAPGATAPSGTPPAPGTVLGWVESPPLQRLVDVMLADSENIVAETLARQVALARQEPASFAGAATATGAVLADLGLSGAGRTLSDGSGLSRRNLLSAELLTGVIAAAGEKPTLAGLYDGLPVGAWSGTLQRRFRAADGSARPGWGVVRAKTGTLRDVNAMAGVVTTASGRTLAFAALANNSPLGPFETEAALDDLAAALATCGCR
ncbi:D-alanyl-D-alanine carboxypeptidase/D-alanyl-D-alanine endopeptidase [Pilimelia anulata]|uniref:D-alanyl-D-alanine carboxypeptidase/D-alanyl-D-alanine endopeptidase n=1 Tax=Pilimelia anulata TaxID=53371 RepID=UPI00227D755D|nr:D-alanyl-D-alanine carboxypeptidase/D-alanyl-D-alanine-endopeptidase [Pilimelia anulata]